MSIGFGILSWRGYASLAKALETYRDARLFELFDRSLLYLPEIEPTGVDIARRFRLDHVGSKDNLGILGGYKALAQALDAEVLVLAENDYPLIEPCEEARRQLSFARTHIERGSAQVWRLRHRERPGQTWGLAKARKYWPGPEASATARLLASGRRLARPGKAERLVGWTAFIDRAAPSRFPDRIRQLEGDALLVSSRALPWANNVFMIRRDFFLNEIIPAAEAHVGGRLINGFPTIETELNRGWWRRQDFWIGLGRGLFTHERADDRGY